MKAAVLQELPASSLEIVDVPEPELGYGEVLISVIACGICGTDLHIMAGESYRPELPFVLGHEPVGIVVSVAPGLDGSWIGKRVVPTLFQGCGTCRPCQMGDERLCEKEARGVGIRGQWGGFAEYLVLNVGQLVIVPESIPSITAASLVDSGITACNAVRTATTYIGYGPQNHLVIGAGPVGLLVAELLKNTGNELMIVESNPVRAEAAVERALPLVRKISDLDGRFNSVIDCAGSANLIPHLLGLLEPHGIYTSVGYTTLHDFDLAIIARRELLIRGIRSGSRADLEQVLSLVSAGGVSPPSCETWQMADINKALSALRSGAVGGKAVIVTQPSLLEAGK